MMSVKNLVLAILFLNGSGSLTAMAEPTVDQMADFSAEVALLVQQKNFDRIRALYFPEGMPKAVLDRTMMIWEARVVQSGDPNWIFAGVEYSPLAEYLARPNVNKAAIETSLGEQMINGAAYLPNTPVVGLLKLKFKSGANENGFLYPVGMTPEGKLCLVGRKPKG